MVVVSHGVPAIRFEGRRAASGIAGLALNPLLLTVDRCFTPAEACGYLRVTSPRAAQAASFSFSAASDWPSRSSASGALPVVVFGGHAEEGFGRVAIALALEEAFAEPVLRIGDQRIVRIFLREVAHGLFGQRIVLALHVADAEVEFVVRRGRRAAMCVSAARLRPAAARPAAAARRRARAGWCSPRSSGSPAPRPPGAPTGGFVRDRQLAAAERARCAGRVRILAGIEGIAAAAAWRRRLPPAPE